MRIDVIVNTTAHGYLRRPHLLDRVRAVAAGRARVHATATLADLETVARGLVDDGSDLVVLSGGDGSFMAGVSALARAFGEDRMPRIALIPGGTVATVARNWGRVGEPSDLLAHLLATDRREVTRRPTLRVRHRRATTSEERIGFMFGTGLVAKFFDVYYERGARGYVDAARVVARIFVESFYDGPYARRVLEPLPCTVSVDGRDLAP